MNHHAVLHLIGQVFLLLAIFLLVPTGVALGYNEHHAFTACLRSALIAGFLGYGLVHLKSRGKGIDRRRASLGTRPNLIRLGLSGSAVVFLFLSPLGGGEDLVQLAHHISWLSNLHIDHSILLLEFGLLLGGAVFFLREIRHDYKRGELGQKEF